MLFFSAMEEPLIPPHGGYKNLKAFQMSLIVHDGTMVFCDKYVNKKSRTHDQMVQAARSGKQNIVEGSVASGTSKKIELKLVGIARASLEELLTDYTDFLRQNGMIQWEKDHPKAVYVRKLCYKPDLTYMTYQRYIEELGPENAANSMVCLINQTNYLLDKLLNQLGKAFQDEGGFTERLYKVRKSTNRKPQS